MNPPVNIDIILFFLFIAGFIVFIASCYGIGKAEADGDESTKTFAIYALSSSIVEMIVVWLIKFGLKTPGYLFQK
jgi:hypothetical protein